MKVLFDTNIILDVLLDRIVFVELSAGLVSLVEKNKIEGYLCATTITTIDYLVSKSLDKEKAKQSVQKLLNLFEIAPVDKEVLLLSTSSNFSDFEDAVQHYSGKLVAVNSIVTRNISDFKQSEYPVYSPQELWSILQTTQ